MKISKTSRQRQRHSRAAKECLESAMKLDRNGREAKAIPLYERALQLGLQGKYLRDALVCYGSSLRNLGRISEALQTLNRAVRRFPKDVATKLFLALTYHDAGMQTKALQLVALAFLSELNGDKVSGFRGQLLSKFRSLR